MKQIENPNIDQNKLRCPDHVEAILHCGHMTVHQVLGKMSREVNASADEVNRSTDWVTKNGRILAENENERIENENERIQNEASRNEKELYREAREAVRIAKENQRSEDENKRKNAENSRVLAEHQRVTDFNESQRERTEAFNASEQHRVTDFNESQRERTEAFNASEQGRTATFNESEAERDAVFENKEEKRDQANEAALNAAESISQLAQKLDSTIETVEHKEYKEVSVDSKGRIYEALTKDNVKHHYLPNVFEDAEVKNALIAGEKIEESESGTFVSVTTDKNGRIIEGIKRDGTKVFFGEIEGKNIKSNGIKDVECPDVIFDVIPECYSNNFWNQYSSERAIEIRNNAPIYINRFYADRLSRIGIGSFGKNDSISLGFNGSEIPQSLVTERVVPYNFDGKDRTLKLLSTKDSVLIDHPILMQCIGDSLTHFQLFWSFVRQLVLQANIDYKKKTETTADRIDCKTIGTVHNYYNIGNKFTYRDVNVSVNNYGEGRSGWSSVNYLRHADGYSYSMTNYAQVAWDALGLHNKYNVAYNGSSAHKKLIADTCSGMWRIDTAYEPMVSVYTWNEYRGDIGYSSVEFSNATEAQKNVMLSYLKDTLISKPRNPFFSINKVLETNGEYAFDWNVYYNNYKTHDNNGAELSSKGVYAIADSYVRKPNVITLCLGTNDNSLVDNADYVTSCVLKIANLLRTQVSVPVIVLCNAYPLPKGDIETKNVVEIINSDAYFDRNKIIKNTIGNMSNQLTNGIYYCPSYYIQGFGTMYDRQATDFSGDKITISPKDVHLCESAFKQWGYQLYSMLCYLLSVGKI